MVVLFNIKKKWVSEKLEVQNEILLLFISEYKMLNDSP